MKKVKFEIANGLTAICLILHCTKSVASPKAYGVPAINNPNNYSVYTDTNDSSLVWVSPPSTGYTEMSNFQESSNTNLCKLINESSEIYIREVARLNDYSRDYAIQIKNIKQKLESLMPPVRTEIKKNVSEMEKQEKEYEVLTKKIDEVFEIMNRPNISMDEFQINKSKYEILYAKRDQASEKIRLLAKEFDSFRGEDAELTANLNSLKQNKLETERMLDDLSEAEKTAKGGYAMISGGKAHLRYDTKWTEALSNLSNMNPSYRFAKMPTSNVVLYPGVFDSESKETYTASVPAVLTYNINGQLFRPYTLGDQTRASQSLPALPEIVEVDANLSLIGACPFTASNTNSKKAVIGMTSTYEFPAAYSGRVKLKYNLFKTLQVIQEQGTRGGLFKSESFSNYSESQLMKDTISVHVEDEQTRAQSEDHFKEEKELRQMLLARALDIALRPMYSNNEVEFKGPPSLRKSGAGALADTDPAVCGQYAAYCAASSAILKGLDAIFGSTDVKNTLSKTYSLDVDEEWSGTKVYFQPAIITFGK